MLSNRLRITHVIGSLALGGAERSLCALGTQVDPRSIETRVITLLDGGPLGELLADQDIAVDTLGMRRNVPDPFAILRLARLLRRQRPDILVTWLDHSNVLGGLTAQLAGVPVVWNIRRGTPERSDAKPLTKLLIWSSPRLSRWLPQRVVYVSQAARDLHAAAGFADDRALVIPNGFDVNAFRPDAAARLAIRSELHLAADCPLVGLFGRFHPDKDHENFVQAAARIRARLADAQFLLCGPRVDPSNVELVQRFGRAGLRECVHLLGVRTDMARLAAALDVQVSSSATEAMPRVVGEAMACGVPCVVTDVGDSALLVGQTGRVVPARDECALAAACLELLEMPPGARQALGLLARQRIIENFSLDQMVQRHLRVWKELAGQPMARPLTRPDASNIKAA